MSAKSIFIGGTSSNAGKSWMVTAVCAWLRRQGLSVAPFKAQNMSNNSFPCRGGGEIGRAQVAQAEACGLTPEVSMNPILLKPNGNGTSQVVVNGRVWKTLPARGYYEHYDYLIAQVLAAHEDLARRHDVIVIEGAGSVSELNLRPYDLVNLGLVSRLGAPWVLVADIERGGVFASIIGSVSLLSAYERQLFRGFLVNKFRGDLSLFDEGVDLLESKTGSPCLGVFPFAEDVRLDAEDSLALDSQLAHDGDGSGDRDDSGRARRGARMLAPSGARIGIVRLPCLSNATDFRLLPWARWITDPAADDVDFVVLPGTKDTVGDLRWMRERGIDAWVMRQHQRGATVVGICGGYQMLGQVIRDPHGVESSRGETAGLGLLPADTTLMRDKTTRVRQATTPGGAPFAAYEIHLGVTTATAAGAALPPFARLEEGEGEGMRGDRVIGTYLHGALEDAAVCSELFGVDVAPGSSKAEDYARLADWFDRYVRQPDAWLPGLPGR